MSESRDREHGAVTPGRSSEPSAPGHAPAAAPVHEFKVVLLDGSQWIVRQETKAFPPLTAQFIAASKDDEEPRWNIDSGSIIAWKREKVEEFK